MAKLGRPEIILRIFFFLIGAYILFFSLAPSVSKSSLSEVWMEFQMHPPLESLFGLPFLYFALRRKSLVATLRDDPKDGPKHTE
ncbi:MAG: hypothetical protein ACRD4M_11665 [Candidatus Acidiferrales bacterium]